MLNLRFEACRDGAAAVVADRTIFMADGQILKIDEPKSFFDPRSTSARGFSCSKYHDERCENSKMSGPKSG